MRLVLIAAAACAVLLAVEGAAARRALAPEPVFADFTPRVSPDGTRVAFLRYGVTPGHLVRDPSLYTMATNGRGLAALTRGSAMSSSNAQLGHFDAVTSMGWSPDGQRIVYAHLYAGSRYDFGHSDLVVANADGTGGRVLTATQLPDLFRASSPSWSRARNQIVFAAGGLWLVNPDGSGLKRLTSDGSDASPEWSPDGSKIALVRSGSLTVINADGSGATRLPFPGANAPAWSPDGTSIAFYARQLPRSNDIYVVGADGSNVHRLTANPADDVTPSWTADGRSIIFASTRGRGQYSADLWVMNVDGSDQRLLIARAPKRASNGRRCTITGTAATDLLRGTPGANALCGLAWNDRASASGGADVLDGGPGKDVLDGGAGNDLILARDGRKDTIRGGPGFDRARVDKGVDKVAGVEKILA